MTFRYALVGAWCGAVLALLFVCAYDLSILGGYWTIRQKAVPVIGLVGAGIGFLLGFIAAPKPPPK